ncbi:endonuclease/exonuclease/phosphatase family protein [Actinomarinicola tropica]|uniref:Endonuclease/exonuclease/phosphatase domain-containing protein n=1 Tax=Actinomarinicola tropica TaxID=2789776 RepID=A0A5Q2RME1_9ACTN|nr:endonuclease/exonuclease/phosphatase family protein [Actinomarinicola tropica]QGG95030.1 hypothetical protein GH723_07875 [Actinomarinicola tropica]
MTARTDVRPAARATPGGRAGLMSALVALDVFLVIELLRAFPALVATRVDVEGRLPFPVQVLVLVVPFVLAAWGVRLVGRGRLEPGRAIWLGGLALGAGRVAAQLVHGDLGAVAAGVGLLGGLVVLLVLAQIGLPLFGGGVVAGSGLAAALRIGLGSRDLIWIDHAAAVAAVLVAVGWFVVMLRGRLRRPVVPLGRTWRAAVPLLSVGPAILLEAFVLTNLGWVAPALGAGWLGASLAIGASGIAGVAAAAWTAASPGGASRALRAVGVVAILATALALARPSPWWALGIFLAQAGVGAILTAASSRGVRTGGHRPPSAILALAPLLLLAAIVALDGRGLLGLTVAPSAVVAAAGVVMLVAAVGLGALPPPAAHHPGWRHVPSLGAVFVLPAALLLAGLPILAATTGGGVVGDSRELRVVSYNVALGFTSGGALNVEEVAAALADMRPDVVALQEVPRGFLPAAGIDMIGWLQHSLGMPYVAFQASSPGGLHGNAILSRHPIRSVATRWFPRTGTALPRGAILARIDPPGQPAVHVVSAHLPPGGTLAARNERLDALLALWADRPRTVVGIDANARPGSRVVEALDGAGLVLPESDALTFPSGRPFARIDFVLHTDDLHAVEIEVGTSRASDHLPVLTVLRPADLV